MGEVVVARAIIHHNTLMVPANYFSHLLIPDGHERHQPLILCGGDELENRVRVQGLEGLEGNTTGGSSSLLLATAGAEDRIGLNGGRVAVHRWKVVFVDGKGILRAILVCQTEDGHQCFDIFDEGLTSGVDNLEECLKRFRGIVNVNDGDLWGPGGRWLRNGEYISEHWRCEG